MSNFALMRVGRPSNWTNVKHIKAKKKKKVRKPSFIEFAKVKYSTRIIQEGIMTCAVWLSRIGATYEFICMRSRKNPMSLLLRGFGFVQIMTKVNSFR